MFRRPNALVPQDLARQVAVAIANELPQAKVIVINKIEINYASGGGAKVEINK